MCWCYCYILDALQEILMSVLLRHAVLVIAHCIPDFKVTLDSFEFCLQTNSCITSATCFVQTRNDSCLDPSVDGGRRDTV